MMDSSTGGSSHDLDMESYPSGSGSGTKGGQVGHVLYRSDEYLPPGWKCYDSGRAMSFKDEQGRRFPSRRKVLEYMIDKGTFSKEIIYYVRDGLLDEGWSYH